MRRRLRLVLGTALCLPLAAIAAPAAASPRYASPDSSLAAGACPRENPCALRWAIQGASAADEVVVMRGTQPYTLTESFPALPAGADLSGEPGSRPVIRVGNGEIATSPASASQPSLVRHLRIEARAATSNVTGLRLAAAGVATDLEIDLDEAGIRGVVMTGGNNVLRDSVVTVSAAGATAVEATHTATGTSRIENVTALSGGSNGIGIAATGVGGVFHPGDPPDYIPSCSGGVTGRATVRNAIARGTRADLQSDVIHTGCAGGSARLEVDHSNFRTTAGTAELVRGDGNQTEAQQTDDASIFIPGSSYRQLDGAPTGDAGVTDPTASGYVDPDGQPRTVDGRTDIGADELPARPVIDATEAVDVTADAATLRATLGPVAHPTEVTLEYGAAHSLTSVALPGSAPSATPTTLSRTVGGLAAETTYTWRYRVRVLGDQPRSAASTPAAFTTAAELTPTPTATPTPTPTATATPEPEPLSPLKATKTIRHAALRNPGLAVSFLLGRPGSRYTATLTTKLPRAGKRTGRKKTVLLARSTGTGGPGTVSTLLKTGKAITARLEAAKRPLTAAVRVSVTRGDQTVTRMVAVKIR